MTDKELAEEYAFTHYGDTDNDGNPLTDDIIMQRSFLAGYEQAKKDLSCVQQRLNMLEDHNMTIDNVISCLEKHNEIHSRQEPRAYYITKALNIAIDFLKNHRWHYPSKGDYPPSTGKYCGRSEPVLVWLGDNNVEYAQWIEESKTWGRGICELTGTVIAWRYIELPKEM